MYYLFVVLLHWDTDTGDRLNIKMSSYQYRDPHVKDKTVSPTVLSLTWESPYLGKTVFILRRGPGVLCKMGHPSEMHHKLKYREALFAHNLFCSCPIILKFCTKHGSDTAMLCVKFLNDWSTETDVIDKQVCTKFELKMNLKRLSDIA